MNRVSFIENIDGIAFPKMIVNFFDHFLALKHIVEDNGKVSVINVMETQITFDITFNNELSKINAMHTIECLNGVIDIYKRPISVFTEVLTDTRLRITLS